jgi:hypothetical protein
MSESRNIKAVDMNDKKAKSLKVFESSHHHRRGGNKNGIRERLRELLPFFVIKSVLCVIPYTTFF